MKLKHLYCTGHFLGLTVFNAGDADSRLQAAVYECDVDNDVSDASEQFDDMMTNLGAVGLLEKFVYQLLLHVLLLLLLLVIIMTMVSPRWVDMISPRRRQ